MIKVKTFSGKSMSSMSPECVLENRINNWLEENAVEIVDIKYSTCGGVNSRDALSWIPSAILIYKEK